MSGEQRYHQPEPIPTSSKGNKVAVRTIMTVISSATLGLALCSGAIVAIALFGGKIIVTKTPIDKSTLIYKAVPIGVAYLIGWVVSLISLRKIKNIVLPYLINLYAWLTLSAIAFLYIAIIAKLYGQKHNSADFNRYTAMIAILFIAFIGLHLLIKDHNLVPFSFPLLAINLVHLFVIVYHYVYSSQVVNEFLWSDLLFFFEMATVSVLMLLHLGVLSGLRKFIDDFFEIELSRDIEP